MDGQFLRVLNHDYSLVGLLSASGTGVKRFENKLYTLEDCVVHLKFSPGRAAVIWAYCLGTLAVARFGDGFSFGGIAARMAFLDGYR